MTRDITKSAVPLSTRNGEVESSSGTFADRLRARLNASGHSTQLPASSALLLDVSSSMLDHIGANQRKIDALQLIAQNFKNVRRFEFSSICRELATNQSISESGGSTSMHLAFLLLKSKGIRHVVMITDGMPDSVSQALEAAKGLKIDVFYVGPDPAPLFLAQLAQSTGGSYGKASLDARPALEAKIRGLLAPPSNEKGPIAL